VDVRSIVEIELYMKRKF